MKVIINNPPKTLPDLKNENFEEARISIDPEKRYAVLEVFRKELFVAVKINSINDDIIDCEYVDKFMHLNDFTILTDFKVNWDCIEYGFCKLTVWAPELANEHGGYFDHTAILIGNCIKSVMRKYMAFLVPRKIQMNNKNLLNLNLLIRR